LSQYHLPMLAPVRATESADLFRTLEQGQSSMVIASVNDGQLTTSRWKALPEDRNLFTPQQGCLLVKQALLAAEPSLRGVLAELPGKFTNEKIRELNGQVAVDHRQVADVARDFLAGLR